MKIALCISGQPRFIDLVNLENIIGDHDVDVFAHFWWHETYKGKEFACNSALKYGEDDPIVSFVKKINPRKISFEEYPKINHNCRATSLLGFHLDEKTIEDSFYRQMSMWTSVKKSIDLIEEINDYDLIVRSRTDLVYKDKVPFDACKENKIYLMNGSYQTGIGREYCDWFYCGPPALMKKFDVLSFFEEYNREGLHHIHDLMYHALSAFQIEHEICDLKAWLFDRWKVYAQFQK